MSETIVVQPDAVDNSAHDAAMIAKAEAAGIEPVQTAEGEPSTETSETPERPAGLPEKFKTVDDMVKAYGELEKKLGAPKEETPAETPEAKATREAAEAEAAKAETPEITPETPLNEAAETLKTKGLDFNEFHSEMMENGELSTDSYKKLADAGIPKEMVDGYVAGLMPLATQMTNSVQAEVGGAEAYQEMIDWATKNLTAAERVAFDNAVTTTNVEQAKLAVAGLNAKYKAAVGDAPNLIETKAPADSTDVYESNAQVTADMKTPLYKKDPAEQARVKAKLARSNIFNS